MIMGLYKSAEEGRSIDFDDPSLETYIPVPARAPKAVGG